MSIRNILAVCARHARVLRRMFWFTLMGHIGEPLFYLLVFGYGFGSLIPEVDGQPFFAWLLPGIAIATATTSAAIECTYTAFTRMDRQKTYLAIASTPISIGEVVAAEALWAATLGTVNAMLALTVGAFFAPVPLARWLVAVAVSFVAGLTAASGALLFASRARGYENFAVFFTAILTPSIVLSGAYFPLEVFPDPVAALAMAFPVTHAVIAARAHSAGDVMLHLAAVAVFLVPFFVFARRGISRRVIP